MTTLAHRLEAHWADPVASAVARERLVAVLFPEYRPDLARNLAHRLGFNFHDFRREVMQGYGWQAGAIPLEQLTLELKERNRNHGVVVFNTEALLAAKPESDRQRWLETLARQDWPHPLVLCVLLFPGIVRRTPGIAAVELDGMTLPEPTLLGRFLR